jgi:hypothetical protein
MAFAFLREGAAQSAPMDSNIKQSQARLSKIAHFRKSLDFCLDWA